LTCFIAGREGRCVTLYNKKFITHCVGRYEASEILVRQQISNRLLRMIFGPKRDDATGDWRRLHNEELNDLYS
jgi:hypothetical protein